MDSRDIYSGHYSPPLVVVTNSKTGKNFEGVTGKQKREKREEKKREKGRRKGNRNKMRETILILFLI